MASVEIDLSKYEIPEDTTKQFDNITTFAKNMILKDSKFLDSIQEGSETNLSKWFGNLLIKYYEQELTNNDLRSLFTFVEKYNKTIDEYVRIDDTGFEFFYKR